VVNVKNRHVKLYLVYFFIWSEWDLELDLTYLLMQQLFENKVDTSYTAGWNGDLKTVGK
jgi:hypothetical protein